MVAISGIVFAVLFIFSLVLIRLAVPADPKDPGVWLIDPVLRQRVILSLNLVPFAGLAFLWFMAVMRHHIGLLEDRFFATVFLGSGLLFVAMLFAAVAVARGLLDNFASGDESAGAERKLPDWARYGLCPDEYLWHADGGRVHVRDFDDWRAHSGFATLAIDGRICVWLGTAADHHRFCLDRTAVPVVGPAGEHLYPGC